MRKLRGGHNGHPDGLKWRDYASKDKSIQSRAKARKGQRTGLFRWLRMEPTRTKMGGEKMMTKLIKAVEKHAPALEYSDYEDIAKHGADAGFNGFIYTRDIVDFVNKNESIIMDYNNQLADDLGYHSVFEMFAGQSNMSQCDIDDFKIYLAWVVLEEVARAKTDL